MESPRSLRGVLRSALVVGSVAVLLAATTCFEPSHVSLADPQAGSPLDPDYPFPGPLQKQINDLRLAAEKDHSKEQRPAKKYYILQTAYDNLPANFKSNATVAGLKNVKDYAYNTSKQITDPTYFPKYFSGQFGNNPIQVNPEHDLYSYTPDNQI